VVGVTRKVCEIDWVLGRRASGIWIGRWPRPGPQYIAACVPVRFRIGEGLGIRVRS
jgi:hypothetical protein